MSRPKPKITKDVGGDWVLALPDFEDYRCASWEIAVLTLGWHNRAAYGECVRGQLVGDRMVIDAVPHPCGIMAESFAAWGTAVEDAERISREALARLILRGDW